MKKSLFVRACNIQGGILESRLVARLESDKNELTDRETINECQYLLETIDYSGYDRSFITDVKRACKYILAASK